jgi:hypothetical protein
MLSLIKFSSFFLKYKKIFTGKLIQGQPGMMVSKSETTHLLGLGKKCIDFPGLLMLQSEDT